MIQAALFQPNTYGAPTPQALPGTTLNIEWMAEDDDDDEWTASARGDGVPPAYSSMQGAQQGTQESRATCVCLLICCVE